MSTMEGDRIGEAIGVKSSGLGSRSLPFLIRSWKIKFALHFDIVDSV
jgi:hypothetical protein